MVSVVLIALDDALPSCLAGWEDLFGYANRISVRRGGTDLFSWVRWAPGTPPPPAPTVFLVPARIPGGPAGSEVPKAPAELVPVLRQWVNRGTLAGAVCAGVFCLAETGLLDGGRATTHWSLADQFRSRFPTVTLAVEALVIDDGDRIVGGGMTAFLDVGLRLVRRFGGPEVARDLAAVFVLDPERRWQSPFAPAGFGPPEPDPVLAQAVDWAQGQLDLSFGVDAWARAVAVEKRTLERRAKASWGYGPAERLRRLRLDRARLLLTGGRYPWDVIAEKCGYADPGAFRRLFLTRFGQTPGEYRRRFSEEI